MFLRSTRLVAVVATALLLVLAPVATAAERVTITIDANDTLGETFTATGSTLCPEGTAETFFDHFGGGWRAGSFHLFKELTCEDGSGTFVIRVNAATVFGSPTDQGGWSVVFGTGEYEGLNGGGNLVGTYYEGGIIDVYTGAVQN